MEGGSKGCGGPGDMGFMEYGGPGDMAFMEYGGLEI